jgi:hypothetical protein
MLGLYLQKMTKIVAILCQNTAIREQKKLKNEFRENRQFLGRIWSKWLKETIIT